jgi:ABC-type uncharacterized transport system substrate-binding protein
MDRRTFLTTIGVRIVAAPVTGETQPATDVERRRNAKLPVIGYLGSGHPSDPSSSRFAYLFESFADGLRELGYVDGQTVKVEWRWAEEHYERLADLAADLVRLRVDVIFTPSDHSAVAARRATHTTPIVFLGAAAPVDSGFAVSLAHPGSNMTGLTRPGPEITGKQLGLLKEAVPSISRVAILRNPRQTSDLSYLPTAQDSARTLGLSPQVFEVRGPEEWEKAFSAMVKNRARAVLALPDTTFYIGRDRLAGLARRHRLPLIGPRAEFAQAGALMAYGASSTAEWRRGGVLVDKILNGAKPADIPIEQPAHLEFVINLKTAKAIGLTIPQSLLLRADQVID